MSCSGLETQELAREKICARAAHGLTTVSISEIKRPVSIDLRTEVSPVDFWDLMEAESRLHAGQQGMAVGNFRTSRAFSSRRLQGWKCNSKGQQLALVPRCSQHFLDMWFQGSWMILGYDQAAPAPGEQLLEAPMFADSLINFIYPWLSSTAGWEIA